MYYDGITASELIKLLQDEINKNGDAVVMLPSRDYPEQCEGVSRQEYDDPYTLKGSIVLY